VLVVYSDESGMGSKKDEPITVITAIVLDMDRQWEPVSTAFETIKAATPKRLLDKGREIKGKLLYSAVRKRIPEANKSLTELLKIIVAHRIPVFYSAIDRKGFENYREIIKITEREKTMTAYDKAFEDCLALIDDSIRTFTNEAVLWITDGSDREREDATKTLLAHHRFRETADVLLGRYTVLKGGRTTIADTIYFGHSHESAALQLADVCCSTICL
jgi:Protein of unknown function (DUF3800)